MDPNIARKGIAMQPGGSASSKISSSSALVPWTATDKLLQAEVVKAFLPLEDPNISEKISKKITKQLKNLYPGDQLYIFETLPINSNLVWARGYSVVQPLPADFISASIDVKRLPEPTISISIFPMDCVRVINRLDIDDSKNLVDLDANFDSSLFNSTFYDEYDDFSSFVDSEYSLGTPKIKKQPKPQLPLTSAAQCKDLADEIKLALKTISSTLFAVYSKNNFDYFEKLCKIYNELDDIRISLHYDLLTQHEEALAKKKVILLMGKFAKLLASGGGLINRSLHSKSDIDGKESILARDDSTAELCQFNSTEGDIVNPASIAQNQVLCALSPNYIASSNVSFVPPKNTKFEETIPSNIMVDFKEVVGSSSVLPKGYEGMKAYMYLRNVKKRLTEAFCINIGADQNLQLDNLAAALFTNIPAVEVETTHVYLVAILTETIRISDSGSVLPVIRKGICAGVADVTRIFSHRKGHLVSGQAHRFVIKLFSSFLDGQNQEVKLFTGMNQMMAKSLTMVNHGWGDLVDRIISGSSRGVAVNPRAERLILSIKELRLTNGSKKILNDISGTHGDLNTVAWVCIPTLSFNPLEKESNRVYLKLNRIINKSLKLNETSFLSVHVRSSTKSLMFAKGTNEEPLPSWNFLSVSPEESIHELIVVRGLSDRPDNGKDYLIFDLFVESNYIGTSKYLLRFGNEIQCNGVNSRNPITVEFFSADSTPCAAIEMDLEVVGKAYNRDMTGNLILNWKQNFGQDLAANEAAFIEMLSKLKRINLSTLVRFFSSFCFELVSASEAAIQNNLPKLEQALFDAIVHLLDVAIARNQEYVTLFDKMINEYGRYLPKVGERLLASMTTVFSSFNKDWNANGRALCRISCLVLRICSQCIKDMNEFKNQVYLFTNSITNFLATGVDSVLADQLLIIDTLELYLDVFKSMFSNKELIEFAVEWMFVNKLKGLGSLEDSTSTALANKKRTREHKFLIGKLFFINRLLNNPFYFQGNYEDITKLLIASLDVTLSVFASETMDLDCSRLALGIYLSVCSVCFGREKIFVDPSKHIYIALIKLLPLLSQEFNKYYSYCAANGYFKKKRTFTQLFPNHFPFTENTMDSIVTDVTFVEVLVEFTIIVIYTTKIFEVYSTDFYQMAGNTNLGAYSDLLSKFEIPLPNSVTSITSMLQMIQMIIEAMYYPHNSWLSMHSIALQGAFLLLRYLEPYMPKPTSNMVPLWNNYIVLLCKAATAKPVSIEHLESTPRKGCFELTTDLRTKISGIVTNSWDLLGAEASPEDQTRFQLLVFGGLQIPVITRNNYSLLKYILLFSMQRNEACLSTGVKIFWSVIAAELVAKDNLFDLEKESVTCLYDLFANDTVYSPQSTEIQNLVSSFKNITTKMDTEDEAYMEVTKLVKTLSRYLASLSELKQVPTGEEFDDDRTFYRLNISSYLMNVDRPELFQSFICDMYETYLGKKNYVQAALSLELLANTWEWDIDTYLPECVKPKLPSQTAFKRKVDLFKVIANNFIKGNKLEQAVDIYTEMLEAYLKFNFDLLGLSFCHTELGKLYGELENVDRLESTFFKIAFIGLGFPESIRGKEFVYEGLPYEHITSVHSRLNRLYPGSRIISNEEEANKLLNESTIGRFLYIKTVTPKKESYAGKLSFMAKQYVDNKNLNTFVNIRRLPGATGITNLWTEEITYKTFMTFPTLMNRSEIKSTTVIKIPPIKNAVRSLMAKNDELSNFEFLINQNLKNNISLSSIASSTVFNSVSRVLAGTVDSPVNGGAGQFKVFFTNDRSIDVGESQEEYEEDCKKLKECYNDMCKLLNKLLKLHGLIIPDTLKPQHESLVALFSKNFKDEIAEMKLDVTTALNYNELMKSLISKNVHSKSRNAQNSFASGSNNSFNQFSQIQLTTTLSHTTSARHRPVSSANSQHGSHHGGRHSSHHTSHRYGGLLVSGSRHSMRDDISNIGSSVNGQDYMDDTTTTRQSSISSLGLKSGKKNILNYK